MQCKEYLYKPAKCEFMRKEARYLGHIITKHGLMVDPEKTAIIKSWPQPSTILLLMSFLGLVSNHHTFMSTNESI